MGTASSNRYFTCKSQHYLKLVKGSHIIVKKLFKHDHAFVLQNADDRIVFVIPYLHDFTLIGTTDILLKHIEQPAIASDAEVEYLCNITNQVLQQQISPRDVIHKFAGIRALHDNDSNPASKMSREYALHLDEQNPHAPALSIFGGKLTTYRTLSENVVNHLHQFFPNLGKPWTSKAYLPGGYLPNNDLAAFKQHIIKTYAPIPADLLTHYIDNYGTRTVELLMNAHKFLI